MKEGRKQERFSSISESGRWDIFDFQIVCICIDTLLFLGVGNLFRRC